MSKLQIDPHRIIEIDRLGRFYVMGKPPFSVLNLHNPLEPNRSGCIIIDESMSFSSDPYVLNKLFRMTNKGELVPVLFKDEDKAQAVVTVINKMEL